LANEEISKTLAELKREFEKKEDEINTNKIQVDNYKNKLEEAQKLLEENEKVIRFLNSNLNASYLPFKNVLKNETTLGSVNITNQLNTMRKTKEENQNFLNTNQLNSDINFSNTATSFAKGAPNFNSLAFNSGNNFGSIQTGQMNNKYTSNANSSNIHQKTQSANNLNAMILPETNFTGYKNLINYNHGDMINLNNESPRSSPIENNTDSGNISKIFLFIIEYGNSNFNSNTNNYNAKTNQLSNLLGIHFCYIILY